MPGSNLAKSSRLCWCVTRQSYFIRVCVSQWQTELSVTSQRNMLHVLYTARVFGCHERMFCCTHSVSGMYKGVRLAPDALKLRVAQLCIGSEARETAIASMLISSPAHHRLLAIRNTVGYLLATDNPDGVWSA
jgi:hypothetical protein